MKYSILFSLVCLVIFSTEALSQELTLESNTTFFQTEHDKGMVAPVGIAQNSKGHFFVTSRGNHKVLEFDANGTFLRSIGDGQIISPHGCRVDKDDNLWVTDTEQHVILKFNPLGHLDMVLGQLDTAGFQDSLRSTVLFNKPADIAFASNGDLFVADGYGNNRVVHLDKDGNYLGEWGKKGTNPGEFDNPHNIVLDSEDRVYVVDRFNHRIQIFEPDGSFLEAWTEVGQPWGLAIDSQDVLYMTEGLAGAILKMDRNGKLLSRYDHPGRLDAQLLAPHGIHVDESGNLYVTEVHNWRVQKFLPVNH